MSCPSMTQAHTNKRLNAGIYSLSHSLHLSPMMFKDKKQHQDEDRLNKKVTYRQSSAEMKKAASESFFTPVLIQKIFLNSPAK